MEAGKLIYINPTGAKLFGVPEPDMLLGKAFSDLVHPANLVAFEQQLAQLEAKENICWLEGVFTRLDGQVIDLEIAATHLTNRNRTTIQMILRDVTEQKRAEAERQLANLTLAESEAQFRATFEQAAVGISWQHPDGRFLQVNQKFCDITGYTPQALLDLSVHDLSHPDDLDKSNLYHRRLWSDEIQSFHGISRYRHKHGHPIWLNITGSLARNPNRLPLYLINIIQDINEFMDQLPYSDPQDQDKSSEPRL
jgi:PAS domain S-box-containing protein